jgi:hypothetical protein
VTKSATAASDVEYGWRLLTAGRAVEALTHRRAHRGARGGGHSRLAPARRGGACNCGRPASADRAARMVIRQKSRPALGVDPAGARNACSRLPGASGQRCPSRDRSGRRWRRNLRECRRRSLRGGSARAGARMLHDAPSNSHRTIRGTCSTSQCSAATSVTWQGPKRDCDKLIALDPDHSEAWLIRSGLRKQTADRNHIRELKSRLARGVDGWRSEGTTALRPVKGAGGPR